MTDDDIQALLREMRDEPVPADSLARVRMRVAEARAPKALLWWKPFAGLAALAALLVLFVFTPSESEKVSPPAPILARMEPPTLVQSPAVKPVRRRIAPRPAEPASDVVVRIETADPDVVILLLGD